MTAQHVKHLRHFVQARLAQKGPHPGHARIGSELVDPTCRGRRTLAAPALGHVRLDELAVRVISRIGLHRAELMPRKRDAIATVDRAAIENRPLRGQLDGDRHDDQKGRQQHQGRQRNEHIQNPLVLLVPTVRSRR